MSVRYVAKAKAVKVRVGALGGNSVAHIVRAGGAIPDGVPGDDLKALVKRGLIVAVKAPARSAGSADAKAKAEADAKAKAKAEADAKAAADAKAKTDADAKAKAEADAKSATK